MPFEYPARDPNTGLNVPTVGCFTFDGDHALAYVRVAALRVRGPAGQRQLEGGPVVGPRPHLPPAGLPAPHAVERARQGPAQPERRPRPHRRRRRAATSSPTPSCRRPSCWSSPACCATSSRAPSRRTRSRRSAGRSAAPPCSSRASRATTCRPCWRCSAARRRSPRRRSRCSSRRRRPCRATAVRRLRHRPGDDRRPGDHRPRRTPSRGERVRHRPAPRRRVLIRRQARRAVRRGGSAQSGR